MKFDIFSNKHQGERCFILGNAPSLKEENLSLLKNEIVFIVNKGYNAIDIGLTHFNYYVLTDERVYNTDFQDIQNKVDCTRFYSHPLIDNKNYNSGPKEDFVSIKKFYKKDKGSLGILKNNIPKSFEEGWGKTRSVVFDAALVAFFMGFKNIYFLGVDLYHNSAGATHFYPTSQREENSRGEINTKFHNIETIIKNLDSYFYSNGVRMINLSKGFVHQGLMNKMKLEEIINEKSI